MKHIFILSLLFCAVITLPTSQPFAIDVQSYSVEDPEFKEKLSQIIDFKIGEKIHLDSPRRFLQISILFIIAQNKNYAKISKKRNVNDDSISVYLNKKRTKFYKDLGISEKTYINYSINHSTDIQEFLETNMDFAYIYDIVQSQVMD